MRIKAGKNGLYFSPFFHLNIHFNLIIMQRVLPEGLTPEIVLEAALSSSLIDPVAVIPEGWFCDSAKRLAVISTIFIGKHRVQDTDLDDLKAIVSDYLSLMRFRSEVCRLLSENALIANS